MKTKFWVRILAKPNTLLDSSLHSTLACFTNFLLKKLVMVILVLSITLFQCTLEKFKLVNIHYFKYISIINVGIFVFWYIKVDMENDMYNNGCLKTLFEIYYVKGHVSKHTFGMLGEN